MKKQLLAIALIFTALTACDELPLSSPSAKPPPTYRPELSGTVDHALCLLGFHAIPLATLRTGHHLVYGLLNGHEANFVLDTGANVSVIHSEYAKQFGLKPQKLIVGTAIGLGGGLRATRARITTLRLGDIDLRQSHVMSANLSQLIQTLGRLSDRPIHGIIGQDVLKEHRAVIDTSSPMLYVQKKGSDPAPIDSGECTTRKKSEQL